ncbi:uncharacterized protein PgNI_05073 [Pyricularia grisea]|uniref:Uncharacterized protein n=1 Tax=Pyricularia grisea TaxID=148305 RepID=A0A6P8BDP4_PYRGI|nr:uncharacterized protein PgNI_05073 [Pyricularia grisea]TLD13933.1 hypothetical protein PgNI_05073 [Pyricularia grisea]
MTSCKYVTTQLKSRHLTQAQIGRLLDYNLHTHINRQTRYAAREELLTALADRFEHWDEKIIVLPVNESLNGYMFQRGKFSMTTPLSMPLGAMLDGFNASYEHPSQYGPTEDVPTSEELLLWIGLTHDEPLGPCPRPNRFLKKYDRSERHSNRKAETALFVLNLPIALLLRYTLELLKPWKPTFWVKVLPVFQSLEKAHKKRAEYNRDFTRACDAPQYEDPRTARDRSDICPGLRTQKTKSSSGKSSWAFFKNPGNIFEDATFQYLTNKLADAYGRCDGTPMHLDKHLIEAGYLHEGLAGLD